jgi:hypothetical protein
MKYVLTVKVNQLMPLSSNLFNSTFFYRNVACNNNNVNKNKTENFVVLNFRMISWS